MTRPIEPNERELAYVAYDALAILFEDRKLLRDVSTREASELAST